MQQRDMLMSGATTAVRLIAALNRVFLAAVAVGMAATFVWPDFFQSWLRSSRVGDSAYAMLGLRLSLLFGLAVAVTIERLLRPLTAIIASARAGDPFVRNNVARLRAIGWALLALQLLDLPCGLLAWFWRGSFMQAPDLDVSVSGWLATLMVFLLARLFASGASMRDEIEGLV